MIILQFLWKCRTPLISFGTVELFACLYVPRSPVWFAQFCYVGQQGDPRYFIFRLSESPFCPFLFFFSNSAAMFQKCITYYLFQSAALVGYSASRVGILALWVRGRIFRQPCWRIGVTRNYITRVRRRSCKKNHSASRYSSLQMGIFGGRETLSNHFWQVKNSPSVGEK